MKKRVLQLSLLFIVLLAVCVFASSRVQIMRHFTFHGNEIAFQDNVLGYRFPYSKEDRSPGSKLSNRQFAENRFMNELFYQYESENDSAKHAAIGRKIQNIVQQVPRYRDTLRILAGHSITIAKIAEHRERLFFLYFEE